MREIERSRYAMMYHDELHNLVFVRRSSAPYPSVEELERTFDRLDRAVAFVPRQQSVMLINVRDSPSRNDAPFEARLRHLQQRSCAGYVKIAALVQTAAGLLHLRRLARENGTRMTPFLELEEALVYLGLPADVKGLLPGGQTT